MKNKNKYYVILNVYSNLIIYKTLNKNEMDLLMTVLFKANTTEYRNNAEEIYLDKNELKEAINKENRNITETEIKNFLRDFLHKTANNIELLKESNNFSRISILFQEIAINKNPEKEKKTVYFKLSTLAQEIIQETTEHFFTFYLEEYKQIKNIYAKRIYTELKQWENVGKIIIKRDELIKKLNAENYIKNCSFGNKVLKPAIKELKKIYDIELKELKKGKKITAYQIKFKRKKIEEIKKAEEEKNNPFSIKGVFKEDLKENKRD